MISVRKHKPLAIKAGSKKCNRTGGQRRNRTADASLFRAALYQLSYLATFPYEKSIGLELSCHSAHAGAETYP